MQIVFAVDTTRESRAWARPLSEEPRAELRVMTLDAMRSAADLDARYAPSHLAERWQPTPVIGRATVLAPPELAPRVLVVGPAWTEGTFHDPSSRVARTVLEVVVAAAAWAQANPPGIARLGVHARQLHVGPMEPGALASAVAEGLREARAFGVWQGVDTP